MAGLGGKRYSYRADNVAKAPEGEGVYQIERNDGTIIYIGSGKIRERLQSHVRGDNPGTDACISRNSPGQYARQESANCRAVEQQLLSITRTLCNRRVG